MECKKMVSVSLNSNIQSLRTQRELSSAAGVFSKSILHLSTGSRINTASDGPAELAVALELKKNGNISAVASRNINDGIAYFNYVDGILDSMISLTDRMNELAVQSANGVYTDTQREVLKLESVACADEIFAFLLNSRYNGIDASGWTGYDIILQVGIDNSEESTFDTWEISEKYGYGFYTPDLAHLHTACDIGTQENARIAIIGVNKFQEQISKNKGFIGACINTLEFHNNVSRINEVNYLGAHSQIMDTDVAEESAHMIASKIKEQTATSVLAQANQQPELAIRLLNIQKDDEDSSSKG